MSVSNPTSPHKHISNPSITDIHLPTRIPKPSPHLIRRSFSLRLRNTTNNTSAPINCEICTKNIDVVDDDNVLATATPPTSLLSDNLSFVKNSIKQPSSLPSSSSSQIKHSKSCPFSTMTHNSNNNNNTSGNKKMDITSPISPRKNVQTIANNKCISGKSDNNGATTTAVDGGCTVKSDDVNCVQEKKILNNFNTSENGLQSPVITPNKSVSPPSSFVQPIPIRAQLPPLPPHHHHHHHHQPHHHNHQQATIIDGRNNAKLSPDSPPSTSSNNGCYLMDDDLESLYSYTSMASGRSTAMSSCDHPFVARNGTTFSGRRMKYVVHCSSYAGQTGEDYLTPTQRAQKHIRRLKTLLAQARLDLEQRDSEILRLTKEVVELRLFKASLNSPEERSNSSDAVTVRENNDTKTSTDVSPIVDITDQGLSNMKSISIAAGSSRQPDASYSHTGSGSGINPMSFIEKLCTSEMQSSFSDSGHFEDITTSSINSKDSYVQTHDIACGNDTYEQKQDLIRMYEEKIEELIKNHDAEAQEKKVTTNDRIEALLQKLAECNTRYADLVPDYEQAKERIRELESQLEDLQQKLQEQENKQNKMYLHMFEKGQAAERISRADQVLEFAQQASTSRVSVPELLHQLQVTQNELENIKDTNYVQESGSSAVLLSAKEAVSLWLLGARKTMYKRLADAQQTKNKVDPEVTLQFLKSAVYYFLTDKENTQGHLNAIEAILGFSDNERKNIDKARASK